MRGPDAFDGSLILPGVPPHRDVMLKRESFIGEIHLSAPLLTELAPALVSKSCGTCTMDTLHLSGTRFYSPTSRIATTEWSPPPELVRLLKSTADATDSSHYRMFTGPLPGEEDYQPLPYPWYTQKWGKKTITNDDHSATNNNPDRNQVASPKSKGPIPTDGTRTSLKPPSKHQVPRDRLEIPHPQVSRCTRRGKVRRNKVRFG